MKIKKNDLFIGIYLLAAVLFFIISIPSWLLDILLAINILVAICLLYTSDAADEEDSEELGGRGDIKKKKKRGKHVL